MVSYSSYNVSLPDFAVIWPGIVGCSLAPTPTRRINRDRTGTGPNN